MQRNEEHQRSEEHEELRWSGSLTVTDTAERYQPLLIQLLSVREAGSVRRLCRTSRHRILASRSQIKLGGTCDGLES
ncbi:hypothetical protein QQF64_019820 [Cirrhinus molitorella]|uniref:Uncharacterized protein n=1 Tax=Cirrhinus molitorella TaxID=172907 RepID=A0ABR3LJW0_9TELE